MSSIITTILSSTLGLLWNKDSIVEKLSHGDVTDAKVREFVMRELTDIKTKLDDLSRKDLLSSYTLLQEGVDVLNSALEKLNFEQKALPNQTKDDSGETSTISSTVVSDVSDVIQKLSHAVEKIKLDSDKEFESAKKRFEDARKKATEALSISIDTLSIEDKIFATKLRIISETLECLDNPENAIAGCLPVLKKLHDLPAIQEIFNVYLNKKLEGLNEEECVENVKSVMLINRVLFEYVLKFSSKNPTLRWPTIELHHRSFNPILHWMLISEKKSMEKELDRHPGRFCFGTEIQPYPVAMNSHSEVLDIEYNSIKIISRTGETKKVELPHLKEFDNVTGHSFEALAVGKNDKVYVLRGLKTQTESGYAESCALSILDKKYNVIHTCLLDFLKIAEEGSKMAINKNNGIIISQADDPYVYICDDVGQLKYKFDTMNSEGRPILCISGKNEILISRDCTEEVQIYTEKGNLKSTIKLPEAHSVLSVTFHHVMCKIIVLTRDYDDLHHLCLYSESGELETTALIRDDFGWCPAVTSHPSGPFAVVTSYHVRFIY